MIPFQDEEPARSGAPLNERATLQRLLDELMRLPGIGAKSAQRIAYYLLSNSQEDAERLVDAIVEVKEEIHFCARCFSYATSEYCAICSDGLRDGTTVCVVAEPRDVEAIERTHSYRGLYHVLGGQISPMNQIAPDDLHIQELLARLSSEPIQEVVLATNLDVEGDITANFIARLLQPLDVHVTRLASGLPIGGDLEFADESTLTRAIEERRDVIS